MNLDAFATRYLSLERRDRQAANKVWWEGAKRFGRFWAGAVSEMRGPRKERTR